MSLWRTSFKRESRTVGGAKAGPDATFPPEATCLASCASVTLDDFVEELGASAADADLSTQ